MLAYSPLQYSAVQDRNFLECCFAVLVYEILFSSRVSTLSLPQVRPRGVGLGAVKTLPPTPQKHISNEEEKLKLARGSYVKVILGTWKGQYGQVSMTSCFLLK